MMNQSLTLTYDPDESALIPTDKYWLIIEQVKEDEKATVKFVAEVLDALFDTSLCVEADGTPPADLPPVDPESFEDMGEVLSKIDAKVEVDMAACELLRMGTYEAELKIVRSHPELPYTLKLSVGTIKETVLVSESVSQNINVVNASSAVLAFPVQSGLRCSWLGSVVGKQGFVPPPVIQAIGNTLFWNQVVTGVIRAEYDTIYDLVTVEIPGVPNYVGAINGKPQDADALAFYHYLVYRTTITPVDEEEGLLEDICGYSSSTGIDLDSDEPLPEPPVDEEQYGCIDYFPLNHPIYDPGYYLEKCCVDGNQHDGCNVRKTKKESGKTLSNEIINRMTAEWPGPIEFIGLGPITQEGCGSNYETTQIIPKNCCDEAEPISITEDATASVLPAGSSIFIFITGGIAPYRFKTTSNATSFADGRKTWITNFPVVQLFAGEAFCGLTMIEITDGCSVVSTIIRSTLGEWYPIDYLPPGAYGQNALYETISGSPGWLATAEFQQFKVEEYQRISPISYYVTPPGHRTVHCGEYAEGGCSDFMICAPCPSGGDALRLSIYQSCRVEFDDYPVLAADWPPDQDPGSGPWEVGYTYRVIDYIRNSGRVREWIASADYNTCGPCGGINHSTCQTTWQCHIQGTGWEAWEWQC